MKNISIFPLDMYCKELESPRLIPMGYLTYFAEKLVAYLYDDLRATQGRSKDGANRSRQIAVCGLLKSCIEGISLMLKKEDTIIQDSNSSIDIKKEVKQDDSGRLITARLVPEALGTPQKALEAK